jgi:uncharacterized protein (TIGR00251 family)
MAESVKISVRVRPNARKSEIVDFKDGVLQLRVAAPPVEGKANSELLEFLSKILGVSKSRLSIEKGMKGRRKIIRISDCTLDQVTEQLESLVAGKEEL